MAEFLSIPLTNWQIWLIIAIILGVVELLSLSFFLIWPALAAGIVALLTLIFPSIGTVGQLILFSLISIILMLPGRRMIQPLMKGESNNGLNERSARLIGQTGKIMSGDSGKYRVKIGDSEWSARSQAALKKGDQVKIDAVDGIILIVSKK